MCLITIVGTKYVESQDFESRRIKVHLLVYNATFHEFYEVCSASKPREAVVDNRTNTKTNETIMVSLPAYLGLAELKKSRHHRRR